MTLNPVVSLFCLYLFANFFAMQQAISRGGMVLEGDFFKLEPSSLIYSFLLQFVVLVSLVLIFRALRPKTLKKKLILSNKWGWFLVFFQLFFLFFNLIKGVNVAGDGAKIEGGSLINYVFVILQPDILFLLIGVSLKSNRMFFVASCIYLLSMMLRGWMGGFFIVIFMILSKYYPVKVSNRNVFVFVVLVFFCLLMLPVLVDAKWAFRTGATVSEFFLMAVDSFSFEKYSLAFEYLLNRFQHVGHVALLFENSDVVLAAFRDGDFKSYWMDGLPQYILEKGFGVESVTLNSYMVEFFFGIDNPTWNTNPGIAGWLFLLKEQFVFMIFYILFIVIIPFYFVSRYVGDNLLRLLSCFSITYLFHGWIGAYFNIGLYALMLILVVKGRFYIVKSCDSTHQSRSIQELYRN
ncbi:MAG: oligosaccharide repeat unit polymerase [Gammaproteobacteria bacterium]|nr:oligosaccharide repeat unit polymerase [Gammaproteobacteria bacterium]